MVSCEIIKANPSHDFFIFKKPLRIFADLQGPRQEGTSRLPVSPGKLFMYIYMLISIALSFISFVIHFISLSVIDNLNLQYIVRAWRDVYLMPFWVSSVFYSCPRCRKNVVRAFLKMFSYFSLSPSVVLQPTSTFAAVWISWQSSSTTLIFASAYLFSSIMRIRCVRYYDLGLDIQ